MRLLTPDPSLSISVFIADGDGQIAHWGLFDYALSPHSCTNNPADAIIHVVIWINTLNTNTVRLWSRTAIGFYAIVTRYL